MRHTTLAVVVAGLVLAGCSTDVTQTEEYRALEAQQERTASQLEESKAENARLSDELSAAEDELTAAAEEAGRLADDIAELEDENEFLQAQLDEAIAAAQAASDGTYPEAARAAFIEGCTIDGSLEACTCVIDELELVMDFGTFLEVSILVADMTTEDIFASDDPNIRDFLLITTRCFT